jgi:hypothetical protein
VRAGLPGRRNAERVLRGLLLLLGIYLIGRAVVELALVDPSQPQTYRQDWGGPHYLGVLLVHVGPGVVAALAIARWWRRSRRVGAAARRGAAPGWSSRRR